MDDLEKTKKAALRLLSFRPRSENELRDRLKRKKLPAESIDRTVEYLFKERMLDDEKFARLYALSRMQSRAFGKGRVRRELALRGVCASLANDTMRAIEDMDEADVAMELAQKRLAAMKGLPREAKKRRLHGFLMRRGFGTGVIFKVLEILLGVAEEIE